MSVFALVSQALRTGEPMHQVLPTSLRARLAYHHRDGPTPEADVTSLGYMYETASVHAVYQLLSVSVSCVGYIIFYS
jgi:hypothetical protein